MAKRLIGTTIDDTFRSGYKSIYQDCIDITKQYAVDFLDTADSTGLPLAVVINKNKHLLDDFIPDDILIDFTPNTDSKALRVTMRGGDLAILAEIDIDAPELF